LFKIGTALVTGVLAAFLTVLTAVSAGARVSTAAGGRRAAAVRWERFLAKRGKELQETLAKTLSEGERDFSFGVEATDDPSEELDGAGGLEVEVETSSWEGLEQFLHSWDWFAFTDTNLAYGGERQLSDVPLHVSDTSEVRVVEGHQMAIGGGVNIGFQVLVSQRDRVGEVRQGVLDAEVGSEQGTTAMRHRDELRF